LEGMTYMSKNVQMTVEDYGVVIFKCYAGSRAYGTNITEERAKELAKERGGKWQDYVSDVDIRGIFIPYPKYLYGIQKVDEFRDPSEEDTVYFSLDKFVQLALEGNPNVVEQLFVRSEDIIYMNEIGKELYDMRHEYISKNSYSKFGAYAWSQLKRMTVFQNEFRRNEKRMKLIEQGEEHYDRKNAMHLVRLFRMGIEILTQGTVYTYRPDYTELLEIRDGKYTLAEIKEMAEQLNKELEEAMMHSTIANVPDFEKINTWVMSAVDRTHGANPLVGTFKGSLLQNLPLEYEMVDKTTLYLVANPLVRKHSTSEAQGICLPHKDWFTGLRSFKEFKFNKTTIEHIQKFARQVYDCNPRHIDTIFAGKETVLTKDPFVDELIVKLRTLPTTKQLYRTAKGYVIGNLKGMEHWEKQKRDWNQLKEDIALAKTQTKEEWEQKMDELENNRKTLGKAFREEKDKLIKAYQKWTELINKKGNLPEFPAYTGPNEESSIVGKYGYNTILSYSLVHTLQLFIELMKTGTIVNSRAYESELYAIKHGKYKTFQEYKAYVESLLAELEQVKEHSVLPNAKFEEFETWLIDYIQRYHQTMN